MQFDIRPEEPQDYEAIYDLTKRAFGPMPFSGGNEQDLINSLRDQGVLSLSLVAAQNKNVIGHIAFSPASAADGSTHWYALGPIAVEPDAQRKGVGSALISEGFRVLRQRHAKGCILVGDPAYYSRHGFIPAPNLAPKTEPAEYFMIAIFDGGEPKQSFAFHPAFYG